MSSYYTPEPGYIYVFRCQQFFKIGKSQAPKDRLSNVQINNPFPVVQIKVYPVPDMDTAEQYLHAELAIYRERGEWFVLPKDVLQWVLSLDLGAVAPRNTPIPPLLIDDQAKEQVRDLILRGFGKKAIIKALWGASSGGSSVYVKASALYDSIAAAVAAEPKQVPTIDPELAANLSSEERAAVQKMIQHKLTAARPSKSTTIQAGFGVSRGGSQLYQRASLIYDALFGQPDPAIETPIARRRTQARFHGQN